MPDPVTGVTAGASVLGGLLSSQGQRSAASTQADAANRAIDLQAQQRREDIARLQPRLDVGNNALAQMQGGAFAQPGPFKFGAGDLVLDPGYQYELGESIKALDRQAAARGGLISGAALKAATENARQQSTRGFNDAYNRALTGYNSEVARSNTGYNRLAGLADVGQTAGTQIGAAGQAYATNAGNLMGQAGQATAAGQLGVGNTFNNALGTMASGYQNQSNFDRWLASQKRPSLYDAPRYDYTPYNANTMIPMQPGGGY
jgi:hypothetical protein